MADQEHRFLRVEQDGNTLRMKSQGPGGMQGAGSGELNLWSIFGALGNPDGAEEIINEMIPPVPDARS